MILDVLDSKLMDLENARTVAERERAALETTDSVWSTLRTRPGCPNGVHGWDAAWSLGLPQQRTRTGSTGCYD
jgi:hypothetical protein